MTNAEIEFIMDAIESTASYFEDWGEDYGYDARVNEYVFKGVGAKEQGRVEEWFDMAGWSHR